MAYDILIKSGVIIDGVSDQVSVGDIGITNDEIAAIGPLGNASARVVINAFGKYVTPGFIDITNHSDTHLTFFTYPNLESFVMQGVTTVIGGNCGASLAPLASKDAFGAIRKWADPAQVNINWASVQEFFDELERFQPGMNFGTFIGYGTVRRGVIGDEARLLTLEELEKVKYLIREGIKAGAWGLSFGLVYGHERVSTTEEIIEVCRVLNEVGGIIKIHLRSEGAEIIASINEVVRIARETGIPIEVSHLKTIGRKSWHLFDQVLEIIERANESGARINFDVSPYHTTGSLLYLLIPAWARDGGFNSLFKRIRDPKEKAKIIEALQSHTLHYDRIFITTAKHKHIVGHTVLELAKETGLTPEETLLEAVLANEGRVTVIGRTVSGKNMARAIQNPYSFIASDGASYSQEAQQVGDLVHPRSFGAFPHFWHTFKGSPATAIKKMSSGPAMKLGIPRRGALVKGNYADMVIFDQKLFRDRATYKNPFRYPAGIEWVIINGVMVVENGRHTGVRVGKVLRKSK